MRKKVSESKTLLKQWNYKRNTGLSPDRLTQGSSKKAWWVCDKGHEWEATIAHRSDINKPTRCPYCSNQKIGSDNNLAVLNPSLAKEWHPTKNGNLFPIMVAPSSGKKAWWVCDKGHEWEATVNSRTSKNSGCPYCSNQSSEPEIRILTELMSIFDDVKSRYKIRSLELDIYIPDFKIGIEYDGSYYHKNKESQDKKKNIVIEKEGVKLVRVRHHPLQPISSLDIVHFERGLTKTTLDKLISTIQLLIDKSHSEKINSYLVKNEFVNQDLFKKYMSYFPSPFPEKSLEYLSPKLCEEWNYKKNKPLLPSNFSVSSGRKVWWKCEKSHEWEATIYARTNSNTGCPYCAGKKIGLDNNLTVLNPSLAKEWHPTKNGNLSPDMVALGSGKKVWWVCNKGHEWEATIAHRSDINKPTRCPYCSGRRACSDNNLEVLNPSLAKEWHPTKNGNHSPDMVTPSSGKKAWWVCNKGHEWKAAIYSRQKSGCPYCSNRKIDSDNNLEVLNSSLAKEWHPTKNGNLFPDMVALGSKKKVWWVCNKGHEWEAAICNRTTPKQPRGCPYCAGKRVCSDNNLAILNPSLSKQWHPTKNTDLSPDMVTLGSNKKVWWVCNKGHEWEAAICNRTTPKQPTGCPHCSRRKS